MTLAIKHVHNLPPHVSYVSTLYTMYIQWSCTDITQKLKVTLKRWSIDTWDRIPQGIINKAIDHWQTLLHACLMAKGCHVEHLLWSSHTTSFFRATYMPNSFFSQPFTLFERKTT